MTGTYTVYMKSSACCSIQTKLKIEIMSQIFIENKYIR